MHANHGDSVPQDRVERNLQREMLEAFQGNIEPVKTPVSYRLGILLVALVMVILPVIYLGIIVCVGCAVYYHAVHDTAIVTAVRGRFAVLALLVYLAPMIIGGILVLFMFKPFLSRPAKRPTRKPLSRHDEPLLFAFVDRVCEAVRAPKPRRIEVDEQVNASASFRRGMLSMLSNDLVLTIGMPLVAGLELRQLGGVLAHEFGHFSQGAGMRLTYIIRTISHWFTRVVYERDAWDEQLVEWSQRSDFRIQWILYLARLFVWLTRRILWVLMMVGHGVSGYMLRQMEFDADRHEARLAGSDVFASTSRQIALLSVASQAARSDLDDFYREGRLCDDLPKLILHNSSRFSPEVLHKIDQMAERTKTGWLDTHPCQQERIASAAAEQAAGIFRLEMPASVLFADYDAQCRQVTLDYYREIFGEQLSVDKVFPVDQLLARQEYEHEAFRALHRFLQGTFRIDRPLRLPSWQFEAPADMQAVVQQVKLAREQIVQGASQYEQNYADYEKSLPPQTAALNEQLSSYEACVGQRIESALQLLSAAEIASQIARAAEWKQEITALLPALRQLNNQVEHISKLVQGNQQLGSLFQQLSQNRNAAQEAVVDSLRTQMLRSVSLMSDIRNSLTGLDYPFEHAQGRISLGDFALAQLPESDNAGGIYEAAGGLIESASRLRARLIGHLCAIAEQVELALGLAPTPEPPMQSEEA